MRFLYLALFTLLIYTTVFINAEAGVVSSLWKRGNTQQVPQLGHGEKMVRGVNLGGWFILESWMTPYLFPSSFEKKGIVDQYTFMSRQSKNASHSALTKHWQSWITETDFQQIAAAGLNTVRLPVPHWAFNASDKEPYWAYAEQPYISQALLWAKQYNLDVMIDLHTAPRSQNGFDNSGRLGPSE
jgi:glucan 1,3-beta-glucosidase